jgi:hypothetical protein
LLVPVVAALQIKLVGFGVLRVAFGQAFRLSIKASPPVLGFDVGYPKKPNFPCKYSERRIHRSFIELSLACPPLPLFPADRVWE